MLGLGCPPVQHGGPRGAPSRRSSVGHALRAAPDGQCPAEIRHGRFQAEVQ